MTTDKTELELPRPTEPRGHYETVVLHGGLAYVSGHLPRHEGELAFAGKVGDGCSIADAKRAARASALGCLSSLKAALGSLARVERVLKVTGYVASAPDFVNQTEIVDAASDAIVEVLGACGEHARSSIGVYQLPRNVPVEIDMVCAIR
jgi:enamine deaminase RidA (YjgF/YER057c/UK114 family)